MLIFLIAVPVWLAFYWMQSEAGAPGHGPTEAGALGLSASSETKGAAAGGSAKVILEGRVPKAGLQAERFLVLRSDQ